jgi:hypothetical protein
MVGSTKQEEWIYEGRGAIHPDNWFDECTSSMKLLRRGEFYMTRERNHRMLLYKKHALANEPLTAFDNYTDEIVCHIASYLFGGRDVSSPEADDAVEALGGRFRTYHAVVPYARDFRLICHRLATTFTWEVIAEDVMNLPSFKSLLRKFNDEKIYVLPTRIAETYYQLTKSDFSRYRLPPTKLKREKCYYQTDLLRASMIKFDHSFPKLQRHRIVREWLKEGREDKVEERERQLLQCAEVSKKMLVLACCILTMNRLRS